MITIQDKETLKHIQQFLDKQGCNVDDPTKVDWEMVHWVETLERMVDNLEKAEDSYRYCTPEEKIDHYFTAECQCGWWGPSKLLDGGGAIGDTGDHFEATCPVCGNYHIHEKDERTNTVSRVEVIDATGRSYVNKNNISNVELSYQDDDRTLKVFILQKTED